MGALDSAEAAYAEGLRIAPNNTEAHIGLGKCERRRGNDAAAVEQFREAAKIAPHDPTPLLQIAAVLIDLGQFDEAEATYLQALNLGAAPVGAYLFLGQRARERGDRGAALAYFEAGRVADQSNHWAHLEAAGELRHLGRIEEAIAAYKAGLDLAPDNVTGHLGLGYCARSIGNRNESLQHFLDAAALAPHDPYPLLEAAAEQRDLGDRDAALQSAYQVLSAHPHHVDALLSIGLTERSKGRHAEALEAFRNAHEIDKHRADILAEMAFEELTLGLRADCDEHLKQAVTIDPGNTLALTRLADLEMLSGKPGIAYDIYKSAMAVNPGEISFQLGALDALAATGNIPDAFSMAESIEAMHGRRPITLAKKIFLKRLEGEYHRSLAIAREATAIAPNSFWIWSERFKTELLLSSTRELENCLEEMPAITVQERAIIAGFKGALFERDWRLSDAMHSYEAAADLCPEDQGIQWSLTRVNMLMFDLAGARDHLQKFCILSRPALKLQGKSLNISQTHFGQILDEYRLDHELSVRLKNSQTLPPSTRAILLLEEVRNYPNSIAAATCLIIALRQSGGMSFIKGGSDNTIPKQIMQFWDSSSPPDDVAALMATWKSLNPGYTIHHFTDSTALEFLAKEFPERVSTAYRRAREPAQKADICRLAWLFHNGGIYVDADNRCLRPISTIVPPNADLVLYQEDLGTIGNDFVAVSREHPVIAYALDNAVTAINRGDTDLIWLSTGPGLWTRAVAHSIVQISVQNPTLPIGMMILDRHQLSRAMARNCMVRYRATPRNWVNAAFSSKSR
jgi:mannosyltransferase OCH1-like enzyme/Flp pilus assembly protein TadD